MRFHDWVALFASFSSAALLINAACVCFRLRLGRTNEPGARIFIGATLLLLFVSLTVAATQWLRGSSPDSLLVSALVLSCALLVSILIRNQGELENLVSRRTSELTTANARLQSLLDNLPAGVVFARAPSGEALMVNRRAVEMLGGAPDRTPFGVGNNGVNLCRPDGKPYPLKEMPLARTLATGQPCMVDDVIVQRPDQQRVQLMMAATPVLDETGQMTSAICVFQDISEREKLQALRDSLTHIIVHDLRNPMHAIAGYLELMSDSGYIARNRDAQECFRHVRTNCQNLVNMTTALLDLSRMEAGELRLNLREWRLRDVWMEADAEVSGLARLKDVRVAVRIPPRLATIEADRSMLRRVLVNLLTNAICFAPIGSTITISARRESEFVRVAVTDEGPGIHPDYHELIFQKSGRIETGAKGTLFSTGLGLAFCKMAAEMQGGAIGLESDVGHGSTFWFTLPASGSTPSHDGSD